MPEHIHKYKRAELGNNGYVIYRCMLPNCSHYLAQHLAVGRSSICWKCGDEFTMTMTSVKRSKPKCLECIAELGKIVGRPGKKQVEAPPPELLEKI